MALAAAGAGGKGAGVRAIRPGADLRGTGISQRQQIANQVISTLCSRWEPTRGSRLLQRYRQSRVFRRQGFIAPSVPALYLGRAAR